MLYHAMASPGGGAGFACVQAHGRQGIVGLQERVKNDVSLDEKSNLPQICLVQICCKYEICKALQPVQRWQWPNLPVFVPIRPLPPFHWLESFANFIFATYLHKANLMQIVKRHFL